MDIQTDYFPIMHGPEIQEEEPLAQLSTLMSPATSMQQLLDAVIAPKRSPTPPESIESSPDIMFASPPSPRDKDEDEGYVAVPAPRATLPPDGEVSLPPRRVAGRFRCPQCPDTAPSTFTRQFDINRHIKNKHQEKTPENLRSLRCPCCYETLSRRDSFRRHILKAPASCLRYLRLRNKGPRPTQPAVSSWESPFT